MKKIFAVFVLFITVSHLPLYSQDKVNNQETIATFFIADGTQNGEDITPALLNQKAFLTIYKNTKTNELLMANFWQKNNTQSFGPIYSLESKHEEESV